MDRRLPLDEEPRPGSLRSLQLPARPEQLDRLLWRFSDRLRPNSRWWEMTVRLGKQPGLVRRLTERVPQPLKLPVQPRYR